jgi:hypothetical protein
MLLENPIVGMKLVLFKCRKKPEGIGAPSLMRQGLNRN